MEKTGRIGLACGTALAGLVISSAMVVPEVPAIGVQPAYAAQGTVTLADAKAHGVKTSLGSKADIYVMAVSSMDHTGKREVVIYGELKMPYTKQDIDIADQDIAWFKTNEYMKSFFEWSENTQPNEYDWTVFKNTLTAVVDAKASSFKMGFDGEEYDIALPKGLSVLDTAPLSGALTEHETAYRAALGAGMQIEEASAAAFEARMQSARDLLARAAADGTAVVQNDLDAERAKLNEAFAGLSPKPFDRSAIESALEKGAQVVDSVATLAEQGKGYDPAAYDAFYRAYHEALRIAKAPDPTSIVGPHEGEPLVTHKDFADAATRLNEAMGKLEIGALHAADTSALEEAYFDALDRMPDTGYGWERASAAGFFDALDEAKNVLSSAYPEEADVSAAVASLKGASQALTQVKLDESAAYTMTVRYRHASDNVPTDMIDAYFMEDGSQVKSEIAGVVPGSERRIYLDDLDLIKKFDGYVPTTFYYASDDTTLGKVRVHTGRDGRTFLAFTAEANGNLDVKYELGDDKRGKPADSDNGSNDAPSDAADGRDGASDKQGGPAADAGKDAVSVQASAHDDAAKQRGSKQMAVQKQKASMPRTADGAFAWTAAFALAASAAAAAFVAALRRRVR